MDLLEKGVKYLGVLRNDKNIITLSKVKNYFSYIESSEVQKLLQSAIEFKQIYEKELYEIITNRGVSLRKKLLQELIKVINDKAINIKDPKEKRYIIDQIGLYSWRIDQSSDKMLQMKCFLNSIASTMKTQI